MEPPGHPHASIAAGFIAVPSPVLEVGKDGESALLEPVPGPDSERCVSS